MGKYVQTLPDKRFFPQVSSVTQEARRQDQRQQGSDPHWARKTREQVSDEMNIFHEEGEGTVTDRLRRYGALAGCRRGKKLLPPQ